MSKFIRKLLRPIIGRRDKTVIYIAKSNGGRLANQLWHFAHVYAYCKENNYELHNLSFQKNAKYFKHFHNNITLSATSKSTFSLFTNFLQKIYIKTHNLRMKLPGMIHIHTFNYADIPLTSHLKLKKHTLHTKYPYTCDYINQNHQKNKNPLYMYEQVKRTFINTNRINIIKPEKRMSHYLTNTLDHRPFYFHGWGLNAHESIQKFRKELLELFKPAQAYQNNIDLFWNNNVNSKKIVVGVHIRHSDFSSFMNGDHFYDTKFHKKYILALTEHFPKLDFQFIIFSDEEGNKKKFQEYNATIANGNAVEDLYTMAKCDLLIGTSSSTYLQWASWYGDIAVLDLNDNEINWSEIEFCLKSKNKFHNTKKVSI